jgi:hypothetical protein
MNRPPWLPLPRLRRPGPADALAAAAGAAMLAGAAVGIPLGAALTVGLAGGAALLAAALLGQRWCATATAVLALAGTALLAGLRADAASTGRTAAEAVLLAVYLVLADVAESRAPLSAAVRALPTVLASVAVMFGVLAALGLPSAPELWLTVLGLLAALAVFAVVAGAGARLVSRDR